MEMFLASSGKMTKLLVCWAPSTKEVTVSGVDGDVRILTQERKGKKYWKVLFFHLIDVSIVNAFVLWKEYQSQHPERADLQRLEGYDQLAFREALVWQLVSIEEADPVPVRGKQPKLPKNAWNGASHLPVVDSSHGRCKVCTSSGVQSHSNVKCETCDVVLRLNNDRNCFYVYHTLDYQGGT